MTQGQERKRKGKGAGGGGVLRSPAVAPLAELRLPIHTELPDFFSLFS